MVRIVIWNRSYIAYTQFYTFKIKHILSTDPPPKKKKKITEGVNKWMDEGMHEMYSSAL